MLKCTRCKQTKEDNEFYPSKHTRCIKCVSEMNAEGYLKRKNKDNTLVPELIIKTVPAPKTEIKISKAAKKVKKTMTKQGKAQLQQDGYYFKWVENE